MDIKVDQELKKICIEILKEGFSLDDWNAHESSDWFQSDRYVGGFDATENEFCFSLLEKGKEYYFQFSLMDVEKILLDEITVLTGIDASVI